MSIRILPFDQTHQAGLIDLILPIQREEFGVPITLEDQPDLLKIPEFYRQGLGNFWVALSGDEVAGSIALLDIGGQQLALRKMFVKARFRGSAFGVGQALMDTALDWARGNGIREVLLGTTAKMFAAHRFYEKNGFKSLAKENLPPNFPVMAVDTIFYGRILSV